jgi:soluble lytic murein transglycosylase-like protein
LKRLATAGVLVVVLLGSASQASAWSDGLLCVAQPPSHSERSYFAAEEELMCAADESLESAGPLWTAPISSEEARRAMRAADVLAQTSPTDSLLQLRLVERAMPRIADRIALRRAGLLLQLGRPDEACDAFRLAADSPERDVAAAGHIGLVRCLLEANKRQGEAELDKLCKRYPRLGARYALRLSLARARETWHDRLGAMALYRSIDLDAPETQAAADARAALDRLQEQGLHVPPLTPLEIVDRGERLVLRGSIEAGRSAIADLLAMNNLPASLKGRVHLMAARAARLEGRWDDVRAEVARAVSVGVPSGEAMRYLPRASATPEVLEPSVGQAKVRKLLAGRSLARLKPGQLRPVLDVAVQYGLTDLASETLAAINKTLALPPQARFDAGLRAVGIASDETVLATFEGLRDAWGFHTSASYYHARALERLGRSEEARSEYRYVIDAETGPTRYYSVWAQARLSAYEQAAAGTCRRDLNGDCLPDTGLQLPAAVSSIQAAEPSASFDLPQASAGLGVVFAEPAHDEFGSRDGKLDPFAAIDSNRDVVGIGRAAVGGGALELRGGKRDGTDLKRENIVTRLGALASIYGAAYPWIGRAADLAELERYDDAAAEIAEAYLAYRDARGDLRFRSGVEAVLTNQTPARRVCTPQLRRDRLALDEDARFALAEAADLLGEPGVALRLRSLRVEQYPRAYADDVEKAAAKFGIDPNLLFAVMRVESVYYRHIVSFAGAIGLMQIMPLTGLRIARALGVREFDTLDLLDPRKNVEFAAWYLSSLITRFDGRLPLAIAAYNGGPHNVRYWMSAHPANMPLDAFLERIPFQETNRYVRRVLANYATYRAQQNLPMPNLAISLPTLKVDTITF